MLQKMIIPLVFFAFVSTNIAQVELDVWLEKDTYLLGEPVILYYKAVNNTQQEFMFDYNIILKDEQGKQYKGIFAKPFVQYKPNFFPGDEKTGWVDVVSERGYLSVIYKGTKISGRLFFLPLGKYTVQFQFDDGFKRGEEVMAPSLSFRVVEPRGKEAEVFEQFVRAAKWYKNDPKKEDDAYKLLLEIGLRHTQSVYAPIIFLKFFIRYGETPEWYRRQLKPAAEYFFRHYPSHPYVGLIITGLTTRYLSHDPDEGVRIFKEMLALNISPEVNKHLQNGIKFIQEQKPRWQK